MTVVTCLAERRDKLLRRVGEAAAQSSSPESIRSLEMPSAVEEAMASES